MPSVIMLSVIMLIVIMPSVIMLNVINLSVIMLSVVSPLKVTKLIFGRQKLATDLSYLFKAGPA